MWHRVAVSNDMPFNGGRLTPEEQGSSGDGFWS